MRTGVVVVKWGPFEKVSIHSLFLMYYKETDIIALAGTCVSNTVITQTQANRAYLSRLVVLILQTKIEAYEANGSQNKFAVDLS